MILLVVFVGLLVLNTPVAVCIGLGAAATIVSLGEASGGYVLAQRISSGIDLQSPASRQGKTNCCESLRVLGVHMDGGMCPHLVLPAHKLHRSESLELDALALVETLCIGAHGCERAILNREDSVLVIGAGPIGLSAYQFAKLEADNVTLADVSEARLQFCQKQLGIDQALLLQPGEVEAQLDERFSGRPTVIDQRRRGIFTLSQIHTPHVPRLLISGLLDSEASVRQAAARSLGERREQEALDGLLILLKDRSFRILRRLYYCDHGARNGLCIASRVSG